MIWSVRNPTSRDKAVRANGGLVTIKAGASLDLAGSWTEHELERYWAAGLVIEPQPEPEPAIAAPPPAKPGSKPKADKGAAG